jgi:hypothetical protein
MSGTNGNEPNIPKPPSVPIPPRPTKALRIHPSPNPTPVGPPPGEPQPFPRPPRALAAVSRFAGPLLGTIGALSLLRVALEVAS